MQRRVGRHFWRRGGFSAAANGYLNSESLTVQSGIAWNWADHCYPKNAKDNLTKAGRNWLSAMATAIFQKYRR
jgi:hypothetical protein